MTWHYDIGSNGTDLELWDHTQDPSTDPPVATRSPPDGASGWSWTGDYPDEILDVMHDEAQTAIQNRDTQRAIAIVLDMAGEQIERDDSSGGTT